MAVVKDLVIVALIGTAFCLDNVTALCRDMEGTCEERGIDAHTRLLDHPDANYRHCEVLLTILQCIEEYLCTCNITLNTELDQTFTASVNDYVGACHNVAQHSLRENTRLKCLEDKPLPVDVPDDPAVDLEVEDTINRAEVEEMDSRLLKECQEYSRCSDVYRNAMASAGFIRNQQQRLASMCLANRYNIVCISDAFCACNEADNELLRRTVDTIRLSHEKNCQEQISEPIMKCGDSAAGTFSGSVTTFTVFLLQLVFFVI